MNDKQKDAPRRSRRSPHLLNLARYTPLANKHDILDYNKRSATGVSRKQLTEWPMVHLNDYHLEDNKSK